MMAHSLNTEKWPLAGIDDLEPAAWRVLRSRSNMVVIAGPGAGKTELLAQRACYLLQNRIARSPRRILAISFKRDAASNLKNRVSQRSEPEDAARFDSFTFDGFAKGLLDRFGSGLVGHWRPSPDYEIIFPKYFTFPDFLDELSQHHPNIAARRRLQSIPRNTFEKDAVLGLPLPEDGIDRINASTWAASKWWEQCLRGSSQSKLTFPMIGRLVELLIRLNPKIRQALLATYSHVFLDEFQDTTHVQYDLVKTIFHESASVLTGVGDNKQQIMRWAMALDDAFGMFEADFGAERVNLVRNYRSSPELVRIQHEIALAVDAESVPADSQVQGNSSQEACKIVEFATPEDEARYLQEIIEADISSKRLGPRDFVILVKQKAGDYFIEMEPIFQDIDVNLRDESDIQDILADQLVGILLSFLRLGSLRRSPEYWTECAEVTARLWGLDPTDISGGRQMESHLGVLHFTLRNLMRALPTSVKYIRAILNTIMDFLGEDNIKLSYPEYSQGDWYCQVLDKAAGHLFRSCANSSDWISALDNFEGTNSLPIMTIHKSKGLEYDTVIFLALDDNAWWSFRQQPDEARSTFFVAFSRAKQRVIFTYCAQRGGRSEIASLYQLLQTAGVPAYEYRDQVSSNRIEFQES